MKKCLICGDPIDRLSESFLRIGKNYICWYCCDYELDLVLDTLMSNVRGFTIEHQPDLYVYDGETLGNSDWTSLSSVIKELESFGEDVGYIEN